MSTTLYAVIMAGGAGTRFWPSSRKQHPKQFLALGKDPNEPLIAATARRVAPLAPIERTLVVTGASLAAQTREALPSLPASQVLCEPAARNTAPCVAWATTWVGRRDPKAVLCVLPADAYIADDAAFVKALELATRAAAEGAIVTLGIEPTRPETGYGYLRKGAAAKELGVFHVEAFVEKPDAARAEQYLASGQYLWNAGIFVFRADVMREALRAHQPAIAEALDRFDAAAREGELAEKSLIEATFPTLPSVSIDTGVMEKVAGVQVVPVSCGWSDVGGWQAAWELGDKDANSNVVRSDAERTVLVDASGNLVHATKGKTVALVGVHDLVVVETEGALLVMPRSRAQDVKKAVDELASRGAREAL